MTDSATTEHTFGISGKMGGIEVPPRRANCRGRGRHLTGGGDVGHVICPRPGTKPDIERFADCVDVGHPLGCWIWTASVRALQYAAFTNYLEHSRYGHRFSVVYFKGEPIPPKMTVDHLCRNTMCVNPDHLEVVTYRENSRRAPKHAVHGDFGPNRGKHHGCKIEGCDRKHLARGWCKLHYKRWRRTGSPLGKSGVA